MTRVGIYLRISEDRDGEQSATDRQKADCKRYAKSHGWEAVDVFEDVDISAFKSVRRPEFERMLEAVRDKHVDGVLAWKIDRITRRQRDLVRLDEACEGAGGFIATVMENIDTREPTGRFVAELLVAQARMESENSSIRVTRKQEEMAKAGKPSLGGTRAFGYSKDHTVIVPEEAELIREAVQRIIAGESIRGICIDWEKRGVKTPTGKPWIQTPLRRMLLSSALSAQRDLHGVLTPGTWPAIITPVDTQRLRLVLNDPARLKRVTARSYLLTGMLRCGLCEQPLVARPRGDGVRRYVCGRQPGNRNCGKVARLAEPVEEVVRESLFVALDGVDLREYMDQSNGDQTDELAEAIRVDEETQQELSRDYYVDKKIGRAEFFAARDSLVGRIESNRRDLAQANGHGLLNTVVGAGETVREQWNERSLDWRRAVLGAVIDSVVIEPAPIKGRTAFDPSLVKIVWKF